VNLCHPEQLPPLTTATRTTATKANCHLRRSRWQLS